MDWNNRGIDIDGRKLSNLRFSDDVLFAKSAKNYKSCYSNYETDAPRQVFL
jgi:hypothetical protein